MTVKLIIFDFDGTIADTYQTIINITNGLSKEFGYEPLDEETLQLLKNLSSRDIVKQSQISLYKLPFLARRIRSELGKQIATLEPIREMPRVLQSLKDRGYQLGIISSNTKDNIVEFLTKQNLVHLFDFINSDKTIFGKHRIINRIIHKYRLDSSNVVYIGDETRDIRSAKKSNVQMIAVVWGFNSEQILLQHQPDFLAQNPTQILEAIEKLDFQDVSSIGNSRIF